MYLQSRDVQNCAWDTGQAKCRHCVWEMKNSNGAAYLLLFLPGFEHSALSVHWISREWRNSHVKNASSNRGATISVGRQQKERYSGLRGRNLIFSFPFLLFLKRNSLILQEVRFSTAVDLQCLVYFCCVAKGPRHTDRCMYIWYMIHIYLYRMHM